MQHLSWNSFMKYSAFTFLALSFLVPVYSFPSLGDADRDSVYLWEVVRHDPVLGFAILVPLLTPIILGRRIRHPWNMVVFASVPLLLAGSAFVVYLVSALSFSSLQTPFPLFPVPFLLTGSSIGIGCWAFVAANAWLIVSWGTAVRRQLRLRPRVGHPAPSS